jgi:hypothetical protein
MFPAFDFNAVASVAYPADQNDLFNPLLDRVLGVTPLGHQPDRTAVATELGQLINGYPGGRPGLLNAPGATNDAVRTRSIAKAVCASVVGSAAMLVQ